MIAAKNVFIIMISNDTPRTMTKHQWHRDRNRKRIRERSK